MTVAAGFPEIRLDQKGGFIEPKQAEMFFQKLRQLLSDPATALLATYLASGNAITIAVNPTTHTVSISLSPCAASADIGAMTAMTVSGAAGVLYTATEQGMINDLKAAVNALESDRDTIKANVNDWKGKSRTAKLLHT